MRLLFDKIFGGGYEAQVLEKKSQRRLFVMLLFYLFFLGIIVDGTPARKSDLWFAALMAVAVFRDARVVYHLLSRVE